MPARSTTSKSGFTAEWLPRGPDDEAIQVHLDGLLERGHPGARCAVARRLLQRFGPRADLLATVRRLEEEHPVEVLGLGDGPAPVLGFRGGLWSALRIEGPRAAELLAHPMAAFVDRLVVASSETLERLIETGPHLRIRTLEFAQPESGESQLEITRGLADGFPNLEHLSFRVHTLQVAANTFRGLGIRSLHLTVHRSATLATALASAEFPSLQTLTAWDVEGGPGDALLALLEPSRLPALKALAIRKPSQGLGIAEQLVASPLLASLRIIDLRGGSAQAARRVATQASAVGNPGLHLEGFLEEGDDQVFEGLEAIRRRPAIYLGSADERGLRVLLRDLIRDLGRRPVTLDLLEGGGSLEFRHESRTLESVRARVEEDATRLRHSGGHFSWLLSVLNALSKDFSFSVSDHRRRLRHRYAYGRSTGGPEEVPLGKPGTLRFDFTFDQTVLLGCELDVGALAETLREQTILVPGCKVTLKARPAQATFSCRGVKDALRALARGTRVLHPPIEATVGMVSVALQWGDSGRTACIVPLANYMEAAVREAAVKAAEKLGPGAHLLVRADLLDYRTEQLKDQAAAAVAACLSQLERDHPVVHAILAAGRR